VRHTRNRRRITEWSPVHLSPALACTRRLYPTLGRCTPGGGPGSSYASRGRTSRARPSGEGFKLRAYRPIRARILSSEAPLLRRGTSPIDCAQGVTMRRTRMRAPISATWPRTRLHVVGRPLPSGSLVGPTMLPQSRAPRLATTMDSARPTIRSRSACLSSAGVLVR
jgi:hypothetical protein